MEHAHIDAIKETTLQMAANGELLTILSRTSWLPDNLAQRYYTGREKFESASSIEDATAIMRLARATLKVITAMNIIIFGMLTAYVLPLMCALLGAAAYGLRSLSEHTLARTFRLSHAAYAQAILAVIVGFAVGLFSDFTCKAFVNTLGDCFFSWLRS
jgi:hypothetical protein